MLWQIAQPISAARKRAIHSVAGCDWNALAKAKGVGPKTAQRVTIELKDKAPGVMAMGGSLAEAQGDTVIETEVPVQRPTLPSSNAASAEALSALGNLGYAPGEAASAVAEAAGAAPEADTSQLIRAALKLLAPKG
jgi:Holliday junction DNA helicase RuvA